MDVRLWQWKNMALGTSDILGGIVKASKLVQYSNTRCDTLTTLVGNDMFVKLVQNPNALYPMLDTWSPTTMVTMESHAENA